MFHVGWEGKVIDIEFYKEPKIKKYTEIEIPRRNATLLSAAFCRGILIAEVTVCFGAHEKGYFI